MKCIHNEEEICALCLAEFKAGEGSVIMQPGWGEPIGTLTHSGTWAHMMPPPCDHSLLQKPYHCDRCTAVLAERERCAKIAEEAKGCMCGNTYCYDVPCSTDWIASQIRKG